MATELSGKMRSKRQNVDSRPYARRQSLLGRMKNTVKDMLAPSWMIDLVNGVRKNSPKAPQADVPLDTESEGEIPVTRALHRLSTEDNMMSTMSTTPTHSTNPPHSATPPPMPATPMPYNPHQMPYNSCRPTMSTQHHIVTNGDDQSDASDFSVATSGCSSMIPQPDRKDYQGEIIQMNDSHLRQMQHMDMRNMAPNMSTVDTSNTSTNAMDSNFLWSSSKPRASKPQPPAKSSTPSFNTSLLVSSKGDKATLHQSPYYPGKTTFGGAASYRRTRFKQSPMTYEPSPTRKNVQARPLNNSSLGGVTSSTAKRILDTLERMSTPLSDAKKIPMDSKMSTCALSLTPGIYRKRRTPNTSLTEGPPTSRRTLSSFASVAKNNNSTMSTNLSKSALSPSAESSYQVGGTDKGGGGGRAGKMKRERGGSHYSSKQQVDDEEMEVPDLSTSFVLPVTKFSLPPLGGGFRLATPSVEPMNTLAAANTSTSSADFPFSFPIVKSSTADSHIPVVNTQFQFSSPIAVDDISKPVIQSQTSGFAFNPSYIAPKMKPPTVNFKASDDQETAFKPAPELLSGSVMDILGKKSPSDSMKKTPNGNIGGIQPASTMKSGSVMDILGKASTTTSSGTKSLGMLKPVGSGWTCDSCLVQNKSDASSCLACTTPKPTAKPTQASTSITPMSGVSSSLGFLKAPTGGWTCDTCLLNNKVEASSCVSCETPKPRAKPTAKPNPVSTAPVSSGGLSHLMQQSKGDWTCDTCLIRNKPDKSKCVSCETPRKQEAPKPLSQSASSGTSSLGFLKPKSNDWTCDACLINNKADTLSCISCTTPKPGSKSQSTSSSTGPMSQAQTDLKPFQFGNVTKKASAWECDTCLVSNQPDATKCVACEMPKPGTKPPSGFTSPGGFSFGVGGGSNVQNNNSGTKTAPSSAFSAASIPKSESGVVGGFSFGGVKNTENDVKGSGSTGSATGGFQFGASSSSTFSNKGEKATSQFGGIKFGGQQVTSSSADKAEKTSAAAMGGFKYNVDSSKPEAPVSNASSGSAPTGGFQFGQTSKAPATEEKVAAVAGPSINFQFGQSAEKPFSEKPADAKHFQFGQAKDANANVSKPLGVGSMAPGGFGGFSNSTVKTDTPPPSFQFTPKAIDTKASNQANSDAIVFAAPKTTEAASKEKNQASSGGFQFGAATSPPTTMASSDFTFGASTSSASSNKEDKPTATVPVFKFGASNNAPETKNAPFSFGASTANKAPDASTSLPTVNFNFKTNVPSAATTTSPGKRGRDDMESGGSDAKKLSVSFATAQPSQPSFNTGFKFGETKPATTAAQTPFSFGQTNQSSVFGTNNATNNNAGGGFGGTASAAPAGAFGARMPGPVFGSTTASTPNAFGAPSTTDAQAGGLNLTTPTTFNFGNAANTTPSTGLFQFSANNQGNASTGAVGAVANTNFTFGQGGVTSTQPSASASNPAPAAFNAPPSFNFTGSTSAGQGAGFTAGNLAPNFSAGSTLNASQSAVFGFNATAGAAAGSINPFNATSAAGNNPRRIKKAVRKLRK